MSGSFVAGTHLFGSGYLGINHVTFSVSRSTRERVKTSGKYSSFAHSGSRSE
jgi:hypothetical protein